MRRYAEPPLNAAGSSERREKILLAEGEKKSQILLAEGEKESRILRADAEKEAMIKKAEGEAESIIKVKNAEAEGIKLIREAEAEGLKSLKDANADEAVLKLKSFEAMEHVAAGQATKIIIPSELQGITAAATTIAEVVKSDKKQDK